MTSSAKRRRRKPLDAPETIEDLLARAGENRFAKRGAPIPMRDWKIAVGPRIADRAHPTHLERGVLSVKVATSVWATELQMLAPEIVARLRVRGYAVDSMRFRIGELDTPERPPERRAYRKVPPPAPLGAELRASIAEVSDPALRVVIERAASANLAWQSFVAVSPPRPLSEAPRGAPTPRGAGTGSAPQGRTVASSDEASRRRREDERGRRR